MIFFWNVKSWDFVFHQGNMYIAPEALVTLAVPLKLDLTMVQSLMEYQMMIGEEDFKRHPNTSQ